jgi:hypothetical protein
VFNDTVSHAMLVFLTTLSSMEKIHRILFSSKHTQYAESVSALFKQKSNSKKTDLDKSYLT